MHRPSQDKGFTEQAIQDSKEDLLEKGGAKAMQGYSYTSMIRVSHYRLCRVARMTCSEIVGHRSFRASRRNYSEKIWNSCSCHHRIRVSQQKAMQGSKED